jgi:CRISPR-associated protein Cas5d
MNTSRSPTLSLRARGKLACFTRPELKVERVSYPVMTPSAARGILEAVCWKPAIAWRIERIRVLKEIRFTAFRRNEVKTKASPPTSAVVKNGGEIKHYFSDEDRAQRNTVALFDVDYVVDAHFVMTDRAGSEDNVNKFIEMFSRRVDKGQHFHQPYLGCREFPADIVSSENAPDPVSDSRELGLMLWDIDFSDKKRKRPLFFEASLDCGVLEVPTDPAACLASSNMEGAS